MTLEARIQILQDHFGESAIVSVDLEAKQPGITVAVDRLLEVCRFLQLDERFYMDFLNCLSGVDLGEKENRMEVVYHLTSITEDFSLVMRVSLPRDLEEKPTVPSVAGIWRAADWHEREAYDLLGIVFEGHPDPRRILMPEDWPGHPLRKDYQNPDSYHDIKVEY
ncbi:NADH-quinone oxidoreductase subunit C [Pontibacter sp. G13]|uniref:NADH-quinone oxidoreductase subunit C n=1 Tax=Pontibacter sp. G13 TaxID=3074898 RepID=UPI00288911FB|nr:NADH-quinone oxidoreductase subunit C [Pontibacter sp. G13]WNJ17232.1 NADH-quinone oxidoreductase subunit C [Pontibacter sp. G13]